MYNGTIEFAAGTLDKLYENVYDAVARETETGLTLKKLLVIHKRKSTSPEDRCSFWF